MERLVTMVGCFGAAYLSWITSASIGWAILHFLFGWLYILYWFFVHGLAGGML